jgi:hypothetical protein
MMNRNCNRPGCIPSGCLQQCFPPATHFPFPELIFFSAKQMSILINAINAIGRFPALAAFVEMHGRASLQMYGRVL